LPDANADDGTPYAIKLQQFLQGNRAYEARRAKHPVFRRATHCVPQVVRATRVERLLEFRVLRVYMPFPRSELARRETFDRALCQQQCPLSA
jgi:hypothetical protein